MKSHYLLHCWVLPVVLLLGSVSAQSLQGSVSAPGPNFLPQPKVRPPLWHKRVDPPSLAVTVAVQGENLYFLYRGRLNATDARTGRARWRVGTGLLGPLAVGGNTVYVTDASGLRAFRASDGRALWSVPLSLTPDRSDGAVWAQSIIRVGKTVVVNTSSGAWGVDAANGRQRWFRAGYDRTGPVASEGNLGVWTFHGPISGQVLGVDLRTGRTIWKVDTERAGALRVEKGTLFFYSALNSVRLIDLLTGRSVRVVYDFTAALPPGERRGASFFPPLVSRNAMCASGQNAARPLVACLPRGAGRITGGDRHLLSRLTAPQGLGKNGSQSLVHEGFLTNQGTYWLLGGEDATRTGLRGSGRVGGAPVSFVEREGLAFYPVPEVQALVGVRLGTGALHWSIPLPGKWQDVLLTPTRILVLNGGEVQAYPRPGAKR